MSTQPSKLLVYGSLMRCAKGHNSYLLDNATILGYGHTVAGRGHGNSKLRMFDKGRYPYVIKDEDGYLIWGELYSKIPENLWIRIWELEVQSGYELENIGSVYVPEKDKWFEDCYMFIYKNNSVKNIFPEELSGSWRQIAMNGGVDLNSQV